MPLYFRTFTTVSPQFSRSDFHSPKEENLSCVWFRGTLDPLRATATRSLYQNRFGTRINKIPSFWVTRFISLTAGGIFSKCPNHPKRVTASEVPPSQGRVSAGANKNFPCGHSFPA